MSNTPSTKNSTSYDQLSDILIPDTPITPPKEIPIKPEDIINYLNEPGKRTKSAEKKVNENTIKVVKAVRDKIFSVNGRNTTAQNNINNSKQDNIINIITEEIYKIELDKVKDYTTFVEQLKQIWNKYNKKASKEMHGYVLDTCYDRNKAKRFEKAMEIIEKLASDKKESLYALLLAMFARMAKDYRYSLDAEWFHLLLHTYVRKRDDTVFFPLCVTKGDVMALYYYILYRKKKTSLDASRAAEVLQDVVLRTIGFSSAGGSGK